MSLKKQTGSYYTPTHIANFIVKRVFNKSEENRLTILEPSAGDGEFIRALSNNILCSDIKVEKILAVEISETESNKIKKNINLDELDVVHADFLDFQTGLQDCSFDLVIGNPPYVKRNYLSDKQIELCAAIHAQFPTLSTSTVKNIWSSFLVRSISLLAENGILALVLPSELLQVKYAKELRELLLDEFERIEVFTFNELLFKECKGQDTLILIAEKKSSAPGLFFCNIEVPGELGGDVTKLKLNEHKVVNSLKWTSHALTTSECSLIEKFIKKIPKVNDISSSKAGIVTAANSFFIVNQDNINKYSFEKYAKPIIQKSTYVGCGVVFDNKSFNELLTLGTPCFLLDFNNGFDVSDNLSKSQYILEGVEQGLHNRFKMLSRKEWFHVPNIGTPAPAFFFKRCHEYPKIVKNEANVLATDTAYLVYPKDNYDINSLIFSFYNSLTLLLAELYGRYYGGGVLELTPNEFKSLSIPYISISDSDFEIYSKEFMNISSIDDICLKYDAIILKNSFPKITDEQIKKLQSIRKKLSLRRQRL